MRRTKLSDSFFICLLINMLLNFEGTLNDVSTLAHELGHSMHSYYSRNNNNYQNSGYKIFVAEVASTVNELLLAFYNLKNAETTNEKLIILNDLLDLFNRLIFIQRRKLSVLRNFRKGTTVLQRFSDRI